MKIAKILTIIVSFVLLAMSANAFAVQTSLPPLTTAAANTNAVYIDLSLDNATGMSGFQYAVTFDPAVYNCSIASGTGSAAVLKGQMLIDSESTDGLSWSISKNSTVPGQIIFSGFESNSLAMPAGYSGVLARIRCKAGAVPGAGTPLNFTFAKVVDEFGIEIPSTAVGGTFTINCNPTAPEVCDGFDNNCDGQADEGGVCGPTCTDADLDGYSVEGGACGPADCNDSNYAVNPGAADAVCDGVDNNCNGTPDDGYVPTQTTCGVGACSAAGTSSCVGGVIVDTCTPGTPSTEVCDGIDNDCNGVVDDGIAPVPTTCGVGACQASGALTCQNGQMVGSCTPGQPTTEGPFGNPTCSDATDNDCDGATDAADSDCVQQCVPSQEVCDGVDNDCDGQIDNGIAAVPTTCGVGACQASGQATCQGGLMVDSCTAGSPSAEVCNGIDDNCDGTVDNGIAPVPTTCGVGVCARTGQQTCQNGVMVNSCTPGNPTGTDNNCNNIDENCNGTADENYVPATTTCGVGACQASGLMICNANHVPVNTCLPNAPQPEGPVGDATCNDSSDNNCNGKTDGADANCIVPRINSLPAMTADAGTTVAIPVNVDDVTGISGFQYFVAYDPSVLTCTAALKGQLLTDAENNAGQSWSVSYNATVPGQIILSGYETSSAALSNGSGPLAAIQCNAVGAPGSSTPLNFTFAKIVDVYGTEIGSAATAGSVSLTQSVVTATGNGYNYPVPGFRASLSLNANSTSLGTSWLKYSFKRMFLSSTAIAEVSAAGGTATVTGTAAVNGAAGCGFTATVTDGSPDAMGIVITPGGACATSYSSPASGVSSGNYVVTQ